MASSAAGSRGRRDGITAWLRALLLDVAARNTSVEEATDRLRGLAFSDLGFARVDHHRELRQGVCEVVYAEGKTVVQLVEIVERLLDRNFGAVLVTRAAPDQVAALRALAVAAGLPVRETRSGALAIMRQASRPAGRVLILSAGP